MQSKQNLKDKCEFGRVVYVAVNIGLSGAGAGACAWFIVVCIIVSYAYLISFVATNSPFPNLASFFLKLQLPQITPSPYYSRFLIKSFEY